MVLGEEALVGGLIFVHADGDDGYLGEAALHFEEAGQFFDAWCAPGGPEVKDHGMSAEFAEVDCSAAVADHKLRRCTADVPGMISAIATCDEQGTDY